MSGSNSAALRGSQQRGSIRDLEAGRRPAYQIPIRRDGGQNYNYPGFGNDPEALTAGAKLAGAGGQGAPGTAGTGGGGSGGGDNPLLRGGDLASIIAGGGTGGGDGGFSPTAATTTAMEAGMRPATLAAATQTGKPEAGIPETSPTRAAQAASMGGNIAGTIAGILASMIPGIGPIAGPIARMAVSSAVTNGLSSADGGTKGDGTDDGNPGPGPSSSASAGPTGPAESNTTAPSLDMASVEQGVSVGPMSVEAIAEPETAMTFSFQEVDKAAPEEAPEAAPEAAVAEAASAEGVGESKGGDVEGSSGMGGDTGGGTSTDGTSDSSGNSSSTGAAGGPGSDGQEGGTSTDGQADSSGNSSTSGDAGGGAGAGAGDGAGDGSGNGGGDGSSGSDGFRHGGYVSPDHDGQFEPVPTNVHEGEFVMRPEATAALGPRFLEMLNQQGGGPTTLANTGRAGPAPMMPVGDGESADNYEEYAEAEGQPWEQEHDSAMDELADRPYGDVAMAADPFSADAQTDLPGGAVTPASAERRMGTLPPEMQQMTLATLGADPMMASAMLHILGPSFASLIRRGMPARPMMAGMQMAPQGDPMMGGGAPGGGLAGIVPGGAPGPV